MAKLEAMPQLSERQILSIHPVINLSANVTKKKILKTWNSYAQVILGKHPISLWKHSFSHFSMKILKTCTWYITPKKKKKFNNLPHMIRSKKTFNQTITSMINNATTTLVLLLLIMTWKNFPANVLVISE